MKIPVFNYSLKNSASGTIDIHIDGDIVDASTQAMMKNWWGDDTSVSFKSFRDQIEEANPKTINLYVNSPGGHVGDAMAMHDYLNELETKGVQVNRKGRGIIASAATYLVMGPNSEMSQNSMMMVHNIQMMAVGDINACENQVRAGRKFNNLVRDFYSNQTSKSPETISSWMNKETWFTAQEAKDNGFVKNITGEAKFSNSIKKRDWPFQNTAILNTYNSFTNKNSNTMKLNLESLNTVIKNSLIESGIIKKNISSDDKLLTDMVSNITNGVQKAVTDAIGTGSTVEGLEEKVNTAVANILKQTGEGSLAELINGAIKAAVTNATKELPTNAKITAIENEFKTLKENVANKLGGSGKDKEKENVDEGGNRKVENKKAFFTQIGNFVKGPANN